MHLFYLRIYPNPSTKGIRSFLKCDLLRILPKVTRDLDVVKKGVFLVPSAKYLYAKNKLLMRCYAGNPGIPKNL